MFFEMYVSTSRDVDAWKMRSYRENRQQIGDVDYLGSLQHVK